MGQKDFDLGRAHKYYSTHCFNQAWDLIDKPDRSPDEDEEMIRLCQASIYHWTQREDCTNRHLSIGYWQCSRIYAMLNRGVEARRYADYSLRYAESEPAFYRGYAYEALARAELCLSHEDGARSFLQQAEKLLEDIKDNSERELLKQDLASLR
jgi:hypothetical protein